MGWLDFFSKKGKGAVEAKPQPSKHFQTFLEQGKIELESRDFRKAADYFEKAITEGESMREAGVQAAYVYKARSFDGMKEYAESDKLYDRAFEMKPDDAFTWLMRGRSYEEQGMNEKAMRYYDKAFELNPMMEDPMLAKAALYGRLGQQDKQKECYRRMLEANPESIKARKYLERKEEEEKRKTNKQWLEGITKRMELREGEKTDDEGAA